MVQLSNEKNPGCLGYIGDYTTQLYRDCNNNNYKDPYEPTSIMESNKGFFRGSIVLFIQQGWNLQLGCFFFNQNKHDLWWATKKGMDRDEILQINGGELTFGFLLNNIKRIS